MTSRDSPCDRTICIGQDTYGLIFLTSNVGHYFYENALIGGITGQLTFDVMEDRGKDKSYKIEFVNSWAVMGIHDIAILIRSDKKLDDAIAMIGDIIDDYGKMSNGARYRVFRPDFISENKVICRQYDKLLAVSNVAMKPDKRLVVHDFWCEPLIPLFINEDRLRSKNNCVILYLRFKPGRDHYSALDNGLIKDNIGNGSILALFNGFGIYDLIMFVDVRSFKEVQDSVNKIRNEFEKNLIESCSMIGINKLYDERPAPDETMTFSLTIKSKLYAEKPEVWQQISNIAHCMNLSKISIGPKIKELNTFNKQGFYDIYFIGTGHISDIINFCKLLESLPFIEDYSTMLNLEVEPLHQRSGPGP